MGLLDFLKKKVFEENEKALQRKARLIEWQNLVLQENHNDLIMSEQQLKEITMQQAESDLRILKDCEQLVENTIKPDVFFMRLNLMVEKSEHLARLEEFISFSGASPAAAHDEIMNNYQEAVYQFLIRYFSDTFDKAEAMKTEKGRIGKYQKFYDSLQEYYVYMNEANIAYVERKYKSKTTERR